MNEFSNMLDTVRRPRILIRAARAGVAEYRRSRDLKRLLKSAGPSTQSAVSSLLAEEFRLEAIRVAGEATYSVQRHVAVLTALIAEARNLPVETRMAA